MARKQVETWIDPETNQPVPVNWIPDNVRERSILVEKLFEEASIIRITLKNFKTKIREQTRKYLNEQAEKYGETWQGNTMLMNFSKNIAIEVYINKQLTFNEKLNIAKQKIDKCIMSWSQNSNSNIVALVNRAFSVDKKGKVDTKRILGLRELSIKDPLWQEAMNLISDSVSIQSTKEYINFKKRDAEGKWHTLSLNWSQM